MFRAKAMRLPRAIRQRVQYAKGVLRCVQGGCGIIHARPRNKFMLLPTLNIIPNTLNGTCPMHADPLSVIFVGSGVGCLGWEAGDPRKHGFFL